MYYLSICYHVQADLKIKEYTHYP